MKRSWVDDKEKRLFISTLFLRHLSMHGLLRSCWVRSWEISSVTSAILGMASLRWALNQSKSSRLTAPPASKRCAHQMPGSLGLPPFKCADGGKSRSKLYSPY